MLGGLACLLNKSVCMNVWKKSGNKKYESKVTEADKKGPEKGSQCDTGLGLHTVDQMPPIGYICVLDFEATCNDKEPTPRPQKIIEFS